MEGKVEKVENNLVKGDERCGKNGRQRSCNMEADDPINQGSNLHKVKNREIRIGF